jgi:hypothetical protein
VASDAQEDFLRQLFVAEAEQVRRDYLDPFCRALSYVVRTARDQKVLVREVQSAGNAEEAGELYKRAEHLVQMLERTDREAPTIVAELEAKLPEILNPPRPLGEV